MTWLLFNDAFFSYQNNQLKGLKIPVKNNLTQKRREKLSIGTVNHQFIAKGLRKRISFLFLHIEQNKSAACHRTILCHFHPVLNTAVVQGLVLQLLCSFHWGWSVSLCGRRPCLHWEMSFKRGYPKQRDQLGVFLIYSESQKIQIAQYPIT